MEGDRKYTQRGYQDTGRAFSDNNGGGNREGRPRQQGPRLPLDVTGPRLPRLVQAVAASRCFSCSTPLPPGIEFDSACPKCGADLHCCKQCAHFEPSTRFQCRKPVPVRISPKDTANDCDLFKPRVTVARDAVHPSHHAGGDAPPASAPAPTNPRDARAAFDSLFRKSDS